MWAPLAWEAPPSTTDLRPPEVVATGATRLDQGLPVSGTVGASMTYGCFYKMWALAVDGQGSQLKNQPGTLGSKGLLGHQVIKCSGCSKQNRVMVPVRDMRNTQEGCQQRFGRLKSFSEGP